MKRVALVLLFALHAHAQWPADLDAEIEKAREAWQVPGIGLTVVKDGKVIVEKGYGVRRLGSPERVDAHTMFDIASLSKSFTAAAAATLVDEGKMRWDDPVRRHLPQFELADPYRTQNATMRDLLAHRLGLERADALFVFADFSTAEILGRMRYLDEVQGFRAGLTYHNLAYEAAAEAIANTAGMPFADVLRKRLIEPLGMSESTLAINHDIGVKNYADGHSVSDGVLQPIRARKALQILGANAVNSTPHDMAKWLLFQLGDGTWEGKRILSAAAMNEMHEPQIVVPTTPQFRAMRGLDYFAGYGLGWQVFDYHGHRLLWHSGGADGMPTYMAILPDDHIGVCVMVNTWHAPVLHGAIAGRILDHYLGRASKPDWAGKYTPAKAELPPRVANTKPSLAIEQYAGTYTDDLYGDMVITNENGKLALHFANGEFADLEHWHYDTFRLRWRLRAYDWADTLITFSLDGAGKATRVEFRAGRAEITATRR